MNFKLVMILVINISVSIALISCNSQIQKKPLSKRTMECNSNTRCLYVKAIMGHILMRYKKVEPTTYVKCDVGVKQKRGGIIISVVIEQCNLTRSSKRHLESIINESSPLPYKGFEKVFESLLNIKFRTR